MVISTRRLSRPVDRLERELGGGGMSRMFLAEETGLSRGVVSPTTLILSHDHPIVTDVGIADLYSQGALACEKAR